MDIHSSRLENTLILEDSEEGIPTVKASNAHCMIITNTQFEI